MFYLLRHTPEKRRGVLRRLFSSGIGIGRDSICGMDFCTLTVTAHSIDWQKIAGLTGGERVILPTGLVPPEKCGLNFYDTSSVRKKLLTDCALDVIGRAASAGARVSVMLIDKCGAYTGLVEPLIRHAWTLTVVTDSPDAFGGLIERLAAEYGSVPIMTDTSNVTGDHSVIIAPDGISGCGTLPLPSVIFAPSGNDCMTVTDGCVDRGDLAGLDGYDIFGITAAAYDSGEFCGRYPSAHSVTYNGRQLPLASVVKLIV